MSLVSTSRRPLSLLLRHVRLVSSASVDARHPTSAIRSLGGQRRFSLASKNAFPILKEMESKKLEINTTTTTTTTTILDSPDLPAGSTTRGRAKKRSKKVRPLRNFTLGKGKSAGRNSSGRITSFHRGGGSKRLQRILDLKRSTSSVGIVERIEYDPNRSSRIALVRWIEIESRRRRHQYKTVEDFAPPPCKIPEPTNAAISSLFSFASLPGKVDREQPKCLGSKQTLARDVFLSALSSRGEIASLSSLLGFPRIAVAGAKPAFFAPRISEKLIENKTTFSLPEIRKWRANSLLWAHRIKRKAALSWHGLRQQETLGLVGGAAQRKADQGSLPAKPIGDDGAWRVDRAPVSYILASHQLEPGKMVVNCDLSKPSKSGSLRPSQDADTNLQFQDLVRKVGRVEGGSQLSASKFEILDLNSNVGNCIPLADIRIGTWVHDIECRPGQGAKLARAAGTYAKIIKEPARQCHVRLPSGVEKLIDSRCRATIGIASNPNHSARKFTKAGNSRWLGRRPVVRGVAMNPVDHPHGGGEGRTKGGRPSVSPWGKPTKAGYRGNAGAGKTRI